MALPKPMVLSKESGVDGSVVMLAIYIVCIPLYVTSLALLFTERTIALILHSGSSKKAEVAS